MKSRMMFVFLLLFTGTVAFQHCDHLISLERGQLRRVNSPNYPNDDGPGTRCRWTFKAPEGNGIVYVCPFPYKPPAPLNHESPEDLPCHGRFTTKPVGEYEEWFCSDRAFSRTSFSDEMVITYEVPENMTVEYFVCYVYVEKNQPNTGIEKTSIFGGCDRTLHLKYGQTKLLKSFNYPNQHPPNRPCRWTIDSPSDTHITLSCPNLYQPQADPCTYFLIYQTGVMDNSHATFHCRDKINLKQSVDNVMIITFTNNLNFSKPFACNLTANHGQRIYLEQNETGIQIKSPNHPLLVPSGVTSSWTVDSPAGSRILLSCPRAEQHQEEERCNGKFDVTTQKDSNNSDFSVCFRFGFHVYSVSNNMQIVYKNSYMDSQPFVCYLTAEFGMREQECHCGKRNQPYWSGLEEITARISGGKATYRHEFPMLAAIMKVNPPKPIHPICTATIISEKHALTAASCLKNKDDNQLALNVGEHFLPQEFDSPHRKTYKILRVTMHPEWNGTSEGGFDLGIVEIEGTISIHDYVLPACLPFNNRENKLTGQEVIVLGWRSIVVESAVMNVIDDIQCATWYPSAFAHSNQHVFCVYSEGKNVCPTSIPASEKLPKLKGSRGGPVLWLDPVTLQLKLVGIQPGGWCDFGESNLSNVIIRVSPFLDWIEENTGGTKFCKL